jgi:glycosyltransferase involved in cell wall biosynthesis
MLRCGIDVNVGFAVSHPDGRLGIMPLDALRKTQEERFELCDWDCDLIVLQRHMEREMIEGVQRGRAHGQIVVNDVDDLFFALPTSNQAFLTTHPKTNPEVNVEHYRAVLAASDCITVSTPYLGKRIEAMIGWKVPIVVLRNRLDLSVFRPHPAPEYDKPVLGWTGATTHRAGDLSVLAGVVQQLLGTTFYETMVHIGRHGPSITEELPGITVREFPLCPLELYAQYLMEFDVGVVPLSKHPFNSAKSCVKGMEYAAAGIPFVASDTPEYRWLADQGYGLIAEANRPKSWLKQLRRAAWMMAPVDVTDLGIDAHVDEWLATYADLGAPALRASAPVASPV